MANGNVEYWSARDIRDYLDLGSDRAARTQMRRWDVPEGPRDPETGVKRWSKDAVCEAVAKRPGRGFRSDLQA